LNDALLAGTCRVEITPEVGSGLIGYFKPRVSTGVAGPLYATSVVLSSGGREVALVSCDLIALPGVWVERSKRRIRDETGLSPGKVMIACTHIHTGPCTTSIFSSKADEDYLSRLPGLIAGCVAGAHDAMRPASVRTVRGSDASLVFNRRFRMKDGSVRTNPGVRNPGVIEPAGPVDPEIVAMWIRDARDKVLGCVFNYSNHVDVMGGTMISPDYPGMLAGLFRKRFGDSSNLVYLNGACGDVNHINIRGLPGQAGPTQSRMMASVLFRDLLGMAGKEGGWSQPDVGGLAKKVRLPARRVLRADLERARTILGAGKGSEADAVFAREALSLSRDSRRFLDTTVQAINIGGTVFVGIPGELFVEIGLMVKVGSPFDYSAVAELANDYVGYLPTDKAFREGGYETTLARSSRVGPGTESILVGAALGLARRLHRSRQTRGVRRGS